MKRSYTKVKKGIVSDECDASAVKRRLARPRILCARPALPTRYSIEEKGTERPGQSLVRARGCNHRCTRLQIGDWVLNGRDSKLEVGLQKPRLCPMLYSDNCGLLDSRFVAIKEAPSSLQWEPRNDPVDLLGRQ